ncbi:glycosyltransferase, partial [bacterium]|nr:glycosyltransferase [bacterium]
LSSLFEGLPRAIMEAMSASLPVVATDVGGVSELVQDGVTGILVPPGDGEAMASGIRRLLQDPDLRERMGASGLKKIRQEFSFERMVEQMEEIYAQLALTPDS